MLSVHYNTHKHKKVRSYSHFSRLSNCKGHYILAFLGILGHGGKAGMVVVHRGGAGMGMVYRSRDRAVKRCLYFNLYIVRSAW